MNTFKKLILMIFKVADFLQNLLSEYLNTYFMIISRQNTISGTYLAHTLKAQLRGT